MSPFSGQDFWWEWWDNLRINHWHSRPRARLRKKYVKHIYIMTYSSQTKASALCSESMGHAVSWDIPKYLATLRWRHWNLPCCCSARFYTITFTTKLNTGRCSPPGLKIDLEQRLASKWQQSGIKTCSLCLSIFFMLSLSIIQIYPNLGGQTRMWVYNMYCIHSTR